MEPFGLIITGQLRSFFKDEVHDSFREFLKNLASRYDVYAVLVVNQSDIQHEQFLFFKQYVKEYRILEYPLYHKEFTEKELVYSTMFSVESCLEGVTEERKRESDGYCHIMSFYYQVSQIQLGIQTLEDFGIPFRYLMRTRFDIVYKVELIPYSNTANELVPHSLEQEYKRRVLYKQHGVKSVEEYLELAAKTPWESRLRTNGILSMLGFGGRYYNNLDIHNSNPKLYMYNDHILIGETEIFKTFLNAWSVFTDESRLKTEVLKSGIQFMFAPESMFLLLLLANSITPIMYLDETWTIMR